MWPAPRIRIWPPQLTPYLDHRTNGLARLETEQGYFLVQLAGRGIAKVPRRFIREQEIQL